MKDRTDGGKSWPERCGEEGDQRRIPSSGMALSAILLLLSGMNVGLFLGGQFTIAGVVYVSLIGSGCFGYWLQGLSTLRRRR